MSKYLSIILDYLPSFLSRYYLQAMLIALPWILQDNRLSINDISLVIGIFFWGSILSSLIFTAYSNKINTIRYLRLIVMLISLISVLCFFVLNVKCLIFLRFFQGFLNGLLRPLSQIWLQERLSIASSSHDRVRTATLSQVYIAIGMSIGALVGSLLTVFNVEIITVSICIMLPSIVCCGYLFLTKEKKLTQVIQNENKKGVITNLLSWSKKNHIAVYSILVYLISLIILKIWIVGVPFFLRESFKNTDKFLIFAFTFHPIAFAVGQIIMAKCSKFFSKKPKTNFKLIFYPTIIQGALTWLMVFFKSKLIIVSLLLIGGGLIPSAIYPSLMMILMASIEKDEVELKKTIFFVIALMADLGQLIGATALFKMNVFDIKLGVMIFPIVLSFILYLKVLTIKTKEAANEAFSL